MVGTEQGNFGGDNNTQVGASEIVNEEELSEEEHAVLAAVYRDKTDKKSLDRYCAIIRLKSQALDRHTKEQIAALNKQL